MRNTRSYSIVKIEADNQTRTADLLSEAPIKIRADVRSNLRRVGDIRVHRLRMTARRDENALSRAVRNLGIACAGHAMDNSGCITITLPTRCRPPSTAMR